MDVGSGGTPGKVAVVQLCLDSSRCDVMHILQSSIPPSLATILQDPSILKVIAPSSPQPRTVKIR